MKTSIILPNWNGRALLTKNLPFVVATHPDEIIVVDDGSTDGSVGYLREHYPQVKVVVHEKNQGFGKSCNDGVQQAKGDIIILLNTDVVPEEDILEHVTPHFADTSVFAVSLKEKTHSWAKASFNGFVNHGPGDVMSSTHISFWANGGSSAISKEKWDILRGFDELYAPFYWEDIDLSYRAWKRGWKVLWEPDALVEHKHESTIGKHFSKSYVESISQRNELIFIWKNITDQDLFIQHVKELGKRIACHPTYVSRVFTMMTKLPRILRKRKVERAESKRSDKEIFAQFP